MNFKLYFSFLTLCFFNFNLFSQEVNYDNGWYHVTSKDSTKIWLDINDDVLIEENLITIDYVKKIEIIESETRPFEQIEVEFNDVGKYLWEKQTEKYVNKNICFIYNNQLITIVKIGAIISSGKVCICSNNSNYKLEQLFEELKKLIKE